MDISIIILGISTVLIIVITLYSFLKKKDKDSKVNIDVTYEVEKEMVEYSEKEIIEANKPYQDTNLNYFLENYRIDSSGIPKCVLSEEELKTYYYTYNKAIQTIHTKEVIEIERIKKFIRYFIEKLLKEYYDSDTKSWKEFDITHPFLQARGAMLHSNIVIPPYVWNLIIGNPFPRVYRVCRDYMKWKKSFIVYKKVFQNVCDWENGNLYRENEPLKKYEKPLWVEWNKIGKDFLSLKSQLKNEEDGIEWLKNTVGEYIINKTQFYHQFGERNEYYISEELIKKFKEI